MMNIANPIYDTVFKYLMEDERIARTILSARDIAFPAVLGRALSESEEHRQR